MSWVMLGVSVVGGAAKMIQASQGRKARIQEQQAANAELAKRRAAYEQLDTSNPYANLENTYEDLTINQQQAEFQTQQNAIQQANIMQGLQTAAGGSGIAGLAQQMANQGQIATQKTAALIGQQEQQNQMRAAQGESARQTAIAQGESARQTRERQKQSDLLSMSFGRKKAADEARSDAATAMWGGASDIIGGVTSGLAGPNTAANMGGSAWDAYRANLREGSIYDMT